MEPIPDISFSLILDIPYRSQWGTDSNFRRKDCGPACVAGIAEACTGERLTIDSLSRETRQKSADIPLYSEELVTLFKKHGIKSEVLPLDQYHLKTYAQMGYPVIVLYRYNLDPSVQDKNYRGDHFAVLTGYYAQGDYFVLNDPNWWIPRTEEGYNHLIYKDYLIQGMQRAVSNGIGELIAVYPEKPIMRANPLPAGFRLTVVSKNGLNIRKTPSTKALKTGFLTRHTGVVCYPDQIAAMSGYLWRRLLLPQQGWIATMSENGKEILAV